jgi:hypothetical protein
VCVHSLPRRICRSQATYEVLCIPVLATPKTICGALKRMREIRHCSNHQRGIATRDALSTEVKLAFGNGDFRWKLGHLRSA